MPALQKGVTARSDCGGGLGRGSGGKVLEQNDELRSQLKHGLELLKTVQVLEAEVILG